MSTNNTLIGRCCMAYEEESGLHADRNGVINLLQHLAAEILVHEEFNGIMTAQDVCRLLLLHPSEDPDV